MANKKHVHALMSEIGPAADLVEVLEFEADNLWTLEFDETLLVEVSYDEPLNRLILSAEVGQPDAQNRAALCETLLQYNYLWSETGGIRLALDGPGGNVVQMFELPVVDLDVPTLQTVLANFIDNIASWRQIISQSPAESSSEEDLHGGAIRV